MHGMLGRASKYLSHYCSVVRIGICFLPNPGHSSGYALRFLRSLGRGPGCCTRAGPLLRAGESLHPAKAGDFFPASVWGRLCLSSPLAHFVFSHCLIAVPHLYQPLDCRSFLTLSVFYNHGFTTLGNFPSRCNGRHPLHYRIILQVYHDRNYFWSASLFRSGYAGPGGLAYS